MSEQPRVSTSFNVYGRDIEPSSGAVTSPVPEPEQYISLYIRNDTLTPGYCLIEVPVAGGRLTYRIAIGQLELCLSAIRGGTA